MLEVIKYFITHMKDNIWMLLSIILIIMMLFLNKKVRLIEVITEQFKVFKNARNDKISIWDICCFIIMPIALAVIIVFAIGKSVDNELANTLTTVFSLVFTILFGFIAILIGRMEDNLNNKIEQTVIKETFVSIISATLISLCGTVISIIITQIEDGLTKSVISCVIYSISFIDVMFLLMTTKRIFKIYCERFRNK